MRAVCIENAKSSKRAIQMQDILMINDRICRLCNPDLSWVKIFTTRVKKKRV